MSNPPSVRNYFVDETGDATLFSSKGRVIVGTEDCSNYFILGILDVPDPDALARDINDLRERLLADPYFKNVPSMQPERRKTALTFHAKDDIPEVRWEVFSLLRTYDLKFFSVVRNRRKVIDYVRQRNDHREFLQEMGNTGDSSHERLPPSYYGGYRIASVRLLLMGSPTVL